MIAIALVACSELYSAYSLPSACYSFKVAVRSAIRVAVRVLVGALVIRFGSRQTCSQAVAQGVVLETGRTLCRSAASQTLAGPSPAVYKQT